MTKTSRCCVAIFFSILLIPCGFGIAALALRGLFEQAALLYTLALTMHFLTRVQFIPWNPADAATPAIQIGARRVFYLIVLTTLNALGSCPMWFVGLMCAATLMQWTGYFLVRPSRMEVPTLPEIAIWNASAQAVIIGMFLVDFVLIQTFPNNFRFSVTFHLAGYSLLASLQVMQMAHDFLRMRRPLLYWFRALAFHP